MALPFEARREGRERTPLPRCFIGIWVVELAFFYSLVPAANTAKKTLAHNTFPSKIALLEFWCRKKTVGRDTEPEIMSDYTTGHQIFVRLGRLLLVDLVEVSK